MTARKATTSTPTPPRAITPVSKAREDRDRALTVRHADLLLARIVGTAGVRV